MIRASESKNCWWLAEQAGHVRPSRMQRRLRDAVWDAEKVHDDLRSLSVVHKVQCCADSTWLRRILRLVHQCA